MRNKSYMKLCIKGFVPHMLLLSFEKCFSKSCICLRNQNSYNKIFLSKPYEGFIFIMLIQSSFGAAMSTHPTLCHHSRTWIKFFSRNKYKLDAYHFLRLV